MTHTTISKSVATGIIGGILGAIGTAAVFTLKDEETRAQLSDRLHTMTRKGKEAAKNIGSEIASLMQAKEEESLEKAKRVSRRAAII